VRRFKWRLQRLLDVTIRKEESLRLELVNLAQETARLGQEIVTRKVLLRSALQDLARQVLADRIARHEVVMTCSQVVQRQIDRLTGRLDQCRRKRKTKTEELLKIRSSRETLERLREEAERRYLRQEAAREQRLLDETAQVAYARKALHARKESRRRELDHE
jgi:flagellar export protein FliJ